MSGLIPEGWLEQPIGNIANVVAGGTPKAGNPNNFAMPGSEIAWLTPADLSKYNSKSISHGARDLSQEGYDSSSAKLMPKGALLFSSRAPIGYVVIAENPICTNQGFKNFVFTEQVDSTYAFYYLKSIRDLAESLGSGTTFKELSGATAKTIPFRLAPLAEQQIIADKLDELLALVESTKARLDAIPAILKSFRQSVLAAAVSGKLTEEWRGDASYLASEHMEPWGWFGVPTSWDVQLYSELTDSRLGKMLDKGKNTGLPTNYLGNINVRWFDFELSNLQEILVSEKELLELKVQYNDVLICEGGEPGRCAIWKSKNNESIIYQKALHRARVDTKLLPEWLAYNLKNDADSLKLNQLFTGTTIKHLTGKALKRYPIRVPSIEEQTEVVRRVEALFAFADKVEAQVNAAQLRVNNLTQSILAKAFRGELTEPWRKDNPELITGKNSAEALLKRIKAERDVLATKKKPEKKTSVKKAALK